MIVVSVVRSEVYTIRFQETITAGTLYDTGMIKSMSRGCPRMAVCIQKDRRFEIFKSNIEFIESFNKGRGSTYLQAVNEFADLTNVEFKTSRNGFKPTNVVARTTTSFIYENDTAPATMDWRKRVLSHLSRIKANVVSFMYHFVSPVIKLFRF